MVPKVLRLWDLDERKIVQKYKGHKVGRLAIRPAFGGPREELVISGSEGNLSLTLRALFGSTMTQVPEALI